MVSKIPCTCIPVSPSALDSGKLKRATTIRLRQRKELRQDHHPDWVRFSTWYFIYKNNKDCAFSIYYTYSAWPNYLIAITLLRPCNKVLDALKYFAMYNFALGIGTDPFLTALATQQCAKMDWKKTDLLGKVLLYPS